METMKELEFTSDALRTNPTISWLLVDLRCILKVPTAKTLDGILDFVAKSPSLKVLQLNFMEETIDVARSIIAAATRNASIESYVWRTMTFSRYRRT